MKRNGFTLVEMLIALAIFGMLTAAGVALLSFSVRTQETADRLLAEVGDVRRANALLTADFAQAAPRPHRDENGRVLPAFRGAVGGDGLVLDLVRGGWENTQGAPRGALQHVEYRLDQGRLLRLGYTHVDGGPAPTPIVALAGVRRLALRYRDRNGGWASSWSPTAMDDMPRAVEIVALTETMGEVRQVFLVGAAG